MLLALSPPPTLVESAYNHLKADNNVLSLIDPATEDASLKTYRGQALAARAYD